MRITDSHIHLWQFARGDYPWPSPDNLPLQRDYLPSHIDAAFAACNVERAIVVQAAPTLAETAFLCELAQSTPWIAGVVGWVDLAQADAPQELARMARHPVIKGIRPMLQRIPDKNWILQTPVMANLSHVAEQGMVFEALVNTGHLSAIEQLAQQMPNLSIVIDHGAKPPIAANGQLDETWHAGMKRLAHLPNLACKLSGLITEAGPDWTFDQLRPTVETILTDFEPARVIWGSDWPVLTLTADYQAWIETTWRLIDGLSEHEQSMVMSGTASRIYGLES